MPSSTHPISRKAPREIIAQSGIPVDPPPKDFQHANSMIHPKTSASSAWEISDHQHARCVSAQGSPSLANASDNENASDIGGPTDTFAMSHYGNSRIGFAKQPLRPKKAVLSFLNVLPDELSAASEVMASDEELEAGAMSPVLNAGGFRTQAGKDNPQAKLTLARQYNVAMTKKGPTSRDARATDGKGNPEKGSTQWEEDASVNGTEEQTYNGTTFSPEDPEINNSVLFSLSTTSKAIIAPSLNAARPLPRRKGKLRVPPLNSVWDLRTFKGKTSRAGKLEFVRLQGRNPEDERFQKMTGDELDQWVRGKQLAYKVKMETQGNAPVAVRKTNQTVATAVLRDKNNLQGKVTSSKVTQRTSPISGSSMKRSRENVEEGDNRSVFTSKRAKMDSVDGPSGIAVKKGDAVSEGIVEVTESLKRIKRATRSEFNAPLELANDSDDEDVSMEVVEDTDCQRTMILTDAKFNPLISHKAQYLVRPIMRLKDNIEAVYSGLDAPQNSSLLAPTTALCIRDSVRQGAPAKNTELAENLRKFKVELGKLRTEVAKKISGDGVNSAEEARLVINKIFAKNIEHGQL